MNLQRAQKIFREAKNKPILVIGDIMLDAYIRGTSRRISPEAPIPIVNVVSEDWSLGGAANISRNLYSLGVSSKIIGRVGADINGSKIQQLFRQIKIDPKDLIETDGPTTLKMRVISEHQHVVRIDRERISDLSGQELSLILRRISVTLPTASAVIISDYGKGFVVSEMISEIANVAKQKKIPVMVQISYKVDPKRYREISKYEGVTCIKPNQKEAEEIWGFKIRAEDDLERCGFAILNDLKSEAVLITRGKDGIALFQKNKPASYYRAIAKEVFDVSGAGDTCIAAFTLCLCGGATFKEAAFLSNLAAGIVVEKLGTAIVTLPEIYRHLESLKI